MLLTVPRGGLDAADVFGCRSPPSAEKATVQPVSILAFSPAQACARRACRLAWLFSRRWTTTSNTSAASRPPRGTVRSIRSQSGPRDGCSERRRRRIAFPSDGRQRLGMAHSSPWSRAVCPLVRVDSARGVRRAGRRFRLAQCRRRRGTRRDVARRHDVVLDLRSIARASRSVGIGSQPGTPRRRYPYCPKLDPQGFRPNCVR